MEFKTEKERSWLIDDNGRQIALIDHPETAPGVVTIIHTEVEPALGGQGIAGQLTESVAQKLRAEGRKAKLTCSYAVRWFAKHPEYADVLADPEAEAKRANAFAGPACGVRRKKDR